MMSCLYCGESINESEFCCHSCGQPVSAGSFSIKALQAKTVTDVKALSSRKRL